MKRLLLSSTLLLLSFAGRAQGQNLITNVEGRKTTSLNGRWEILVDPYDIGSGNNGFFKDAKPKTKSDLIEYAFDPALSLNVPGDWNTQSDRLFFYEGTIWYKKTFDYRLSKPARLFLYFAGANYRTDVFLNGKMLGMHEGGFTPFNFEITDLVHETGNDLIVKVNDRRSRDGVPEMVTDWWNYGGITRRVELVEVPETFVRDYSLQLGKGSQNQISGWVRLNGPHPSQKVTVQIPEAKIDKVFSATSEGYCEINFNVDLTLWSPEAPKLYKVIIASETDKVEDEIGFRTVEVRGTDILLNGKPIFLRGVCIHEEAPFRSGRAFNRNDAGTLLGWAKELGCNFVRLAHYPHNEDMVREADHLGILVWAEVPVYWNIEWENPATLANAEHQLSEEIERDKNRAAIICWSVANETPVGPARLSFLRKLIERARSLDQTRLITAALLHRYDGPTTQIIDDPLGEYLDVIGCNEYIGWYDGLPEKADQMEWKNRYQKPVIMSEFGGAAAFGHHGDELTRWTEEYQASLYRHQLAMLKKIPFLRGTSPWILMDFRSPRRLLPGIQDYFNRKGLVSDRGEKKQAFFILREFYQSLEQQSPVRHR
jgi:beta-glucuronidase